MILGPVSQRQRIDGEDSPTLCPELTFLGSGLIELQLKQMKRKRNDNFQGR